MRRSLCRHVKILPESAGIVFGGGFPRDDDAECRRAAQRAIFHVQKELEATGDAHNPAIVLCDRGTVDGLAYWPGPPGDFWTSTATTMDTELHRYDTVLHLRTPTADQGYNHQNPLRTETALRAADVDARILQVFAEAYADQVSRSTGVGLFSGGTQRTAILYSKNDLMGAWSRRADGTFVHDSLDSGEAGRERAFRLGANIVLYALNVDYKSDQVHIPFILKRRRL